jgi:hypothetical protein
VTELDVFFVFLLFLWYTSFALWVDPLSSSKDRTAGIEPWCGFLNSFVTERPYRLMVASAEGATTAAAGATTAAAFGVFCWLEVTLFDFTPFFIFLCFLLHITF